jgi:hypothetical protein
MLQCTDVPAFSYVQVRWLQDLPLVDVPRTHTRNEVLADGQWTVRVTFLEQACVRVMKPSPMEQVRCLVCSHRAPPSVADPPPVRHAAVHIS